MTFTPVMSQFESGTLQGALLPAVVIDNLDPEKQHRVKLRVATLHGGYSDEHIPWSKPIGNLFQGNSRGVGGFAVPVIGARVWRYSPQDDEHNHYYMGSMTSNDTRLTELEEDYPNCYGFIDRSGNLFKVNTTKSTVVFCHVSGMRVEIGANGKTDVVSPEEISFKSLKRINLSALVEINLDAPRINQNGGTNSATALTPQPRTRPPDTPFSGKSNY